MPQFRTEHESDRELAARIIDGGDEVAFRKLYRQHGPALVRLLDGMFGGGHEVDDAVQESWIIAMERLAAFRWESTFRTWLLGIGFNVARSARRRLANHAALSLDVLAEVTVAEHDPMIDLNRALDELAEGHRAVFLLHDVEGLTHREIAKRLGIVVGTSKSQLSDARRVLRALLEPGEA